MEFGRNPKALTNAEFLRDPKDATQGDVFLQSEGDLNGQRLKVAILYDNEKIETAFAVAGRLDPKLAMPVSPMPQFLEVK